MARPRRGPYHPRPMGKWQSSQRWRLRGLTKLSSDPCGDAQKMSLELACPRLLPEDCSLQRQLLFRSAKLVSLIQLCTISPASLFICNNQLSRSAVCSNSVSAQLCIISTISFWGPVASPSGSPGHVIPVLFVCLSSVSLKPQVGPSAV